jgi:hypothetical protein
MELVDARRGRERQRSKGSDTGNAESQKLIYLRTVLVN